MGFPTVEDVEEAIKTQSADWRGWCYEIACAILDSGLIKGRAAYGHYYGPVAPLWATKMAKWGAYSQDMSTAPIRPHGWIALADGDVCDPTRWVWTDTEPDIWIGPDDEYDEGGNIWRRAHLPDQPTPSGRNVNITLPPHARVLLGLTPNDDVTLGHLFWLGNLPPEELMPAAPIYDALDVVGLGAIVPIDNYKLVRATEKESA